VLRDVVRAQACEQIGREDIVVIVEEEHEARTRGARDDVVRVRERDANRALDGGQCCGGLRDDERAAREVIDPEGPIPGRDDRFDVGWESRDRIAGDEPARIDRPAGAVIGGERRPIRRLTAGEDDVVEVWRDQPAASRAASTGS